MADGGLESPSAIRHPPSVHAISCLQAGCADCAAREYSQNVATRSPVSVSADATIPPEIFSSKETHDTRQNEVETRGHPDVRRRASGSCRAEAPVGEQTEHCPVTLPSQGQRRRPQH